MHGACMTCMEMCGNGARRGMAIMHLQMPLTRLGLIQAHPVFFAGVAGSALLKIAGQACATVTLRTGSGMTWDFVLHGLCIFDVVMFYLLDRIYRILCISMCQICI